MKARLYGLIILPSCFLSAAYAEETTIASVQAAIASHRTTCVQLVSAQIARIKKYNLAVYDKPPLNAITQINPSALDEARQLDAAFAKSKKLSGPLHCVTAILKDNIDTFDTNTSAGSYALLGNQPVQDAFLVAQLRKAGAIIIAKGGMDEFAGGMFGTSSRNGRIGNAYDTSQNPGGSSGGSAVGVSADFALIGIGTDNSGSVRIPAVFNGLVGLRPSTGLISQRGIVPLGNVDGVAGPMMRTTKDLARVLDVIAAADPADPKTVNLPRTPSYQSYLRADGLRGKRIGRVHLVGNVDTRKDIPADIQRVLQTADQKMEQTGATIIDIDLPAFDNNRADNQAGEVEEVNEYLSSFPAVRENFIDLCKSDRTQSFGDESDCLKFIAVTPSKHSGEYQQVLAMFAKNREYVQGLMKTNHLDALLIPISTHGSATYDGMTVNTWRAPVSSNTGMPAIAFVAGYDQSNMPVGVELVGEQYNEGALIAMAYSYEVHATPRITPTLPAPNAAVAALSTPKFNNLITLIGTSAYNKVLRNINPLTQWYDALSPQVFRGIAAAEITENSEGDRKTGQLEPDK